MKNTIPLKINNINDFTSDLEKGSVELYMELKKFLTDGFRKINKNEIKSGIKCYRLTSFELIEVQVIEIWSNFNIRIIDINSYDSMEYGVSINDLYLPILKKGENNDNKNS